MTTRRLLAWLALAVASGFAVAWAFPRLFPFLPPAWDTSRAEAQEIALARIARLGEVPPGAYVATRFSVDWNLERRLRRQARGGEAPRPAGDLALADLQGWTTQVFPPGAPPFEPLYQVFVTPAGEVGELRMYLRADEAVPPIDPEAARAGAVELLTESGVDLARFGEAEVRTRELPARSDVVVRFPSRQGQLGPDVRYGLEVTWLGERLGGFSTWRDDPDQRLFEEELRQYFLVGVSGTILLFLIVPLVAAPFVRRYHEGEVGVRRGTQLFLFTLGCGLLATVLIAPGASFGTGLGSVPRSQVTWVVGLIMTAFTVLPGALGASLAWSLGEARVRARSGGRLASFDALLRGHWRQGAVARSSLAGWSLGLALAAITLVACLGLARLGFEPVGLWDQAESGSDWSGLATLAWSLSLGLATLLLACLFFGTLGYRRFGLRRGAALGAFAAWLVLQPPVIPLPLSGGALVWILWAAVPVLVFAFGDLLAALLCGLVASTLLQALPMLFADDPWLQLQAALPLAALAAPLVASLRWVQSRDELAYTWDDVPPHVRRIAERERQRVELETAREIQASILPELPPQLAGVELAHAYLPASEVGGDFYDVLALEDGRLAAAVGDVAGHGVSSGLVMSMVKSALAVQATFRPEVHDVMTTLNRMVYQSARRRMLTTLAYVLLDPVRRELEYGSAGHVFPYRVAAGGRVEALEAGDYPLGVRPTYTPRIHRESLEPGDAVVLLSDGIVEGRRENSIEPFGFERVERSLSRHAGGSAQALSRGLLADLEDFTGRAPREDDLTILVMRLPAA